MLSAVYVWHARPTSHINRWFGLFTLAISGWSFGIAGVETGFRTEFWGRVTFGSAALIPAGFLGFSDVFPAPTSWRPLRYIKILVYCFGALLAGLSLFTDQIAHDIYRTATGIERAAGQLYPFFAIFILVCTVGTLGLFIHKWRQARGLPRAQLQYLGIGMATLTVGGITTNLLIPALTGQSSFSWAGPFFAFPLVALTAHSIIRHRLMDLRLVIHRGLAYLVVLLAVSSAGVAVGRMLFSDWHTNRLSLPADLAVFLIAVFVMLSRPAERIFTRLIDPYLYRGRLDHSVALRDATHRLSHLMQPAEFSSELSAILLEAFVPESLLMVAQAPENGTFEVLYSDHPLPPTVDLLNPLLLAYRGRSSILTPSDPSRGSDSFDQLRALGIEVMIVLRRRGEVLGAVLLGSRRSGDAYFASDLTFIESLAELASIALENALLYRQRIQMLEFSERLLESLHSAVVAVSVDGTIVSFNRAAKDLLGPEQDLQGQPLDILPSEVSWTLALAVSGQWQPREVEVTIDTAVRESIPIILSTAVLHSETAEPSGAFIVITDLSTVKALERNQRRIEHFATMARFYAGLAHEIRSPLTSISNFVAMLADRFDDGEFRDTAARVLPAEVARIVQLADRLRLMAPSESGTFTPISLKNLLADIIAIHTPSAEELGINLVLVASSDIRLIMGDPGQLIQLFVNLINNALESMAKPGVVSIDIASSPRAGQPTIAVRIADEGSGIDPALRTKIFQPFFTTKSSGTGLGLAICQEIAAFHRAHLSVTPRVDTQGSVACVEFPAAPDVVTHDPVTLHTSPNPVGDAVNRD